MVATTLCIKSTRIKGQVAEQSSMSKVENVSNTTSFSCLHTLMGSFQNTLSS